LIISIPDLLTFNPYGVGALGAHFPQVAPVAMKTPIGVGEFFFGAPQVAPVAIHSLPNVGRFMVGKWAIRSGYHPITCRPLRWATVHPKFCTLL